MLSRSSLFARIISRCLQKNDYSIKIGDKPLGNMFFNQNVQYFIRGLISFDASAVFSPQQLGTKLSAPLYKFMTSEEVENSKRYFQKRAWKLLQPPPLIDVTEDKIEILSDDKCLDGHEVHHAKLVFTDTSPYEYPEDRVIVVRQPDGKLRKAFKNERSRMNQVYFPRDGRSLDAPKMFEKENLDKVLDNGHYTFILDRACQQFDPSDQEFHDVLSATFDRIDERSDYKKIIKTRHFGTFVFYLAARKQINNLLQNFIESKKLIRASLLVSLYHCLHSPERSELGDHSRRSIDVAHRILEEFISNPSNGALHLKPILDDNLTSLKNKIERDEALLHAHGVQSA